MINNQKGMSKSILFTALIGGLYLLFVVLFFNIESSILTKVLSYSTIVLSVSSIAIFTKKAKTIFNQYNLFLVSFFLFSFGQVYLYAFGTAYKELDFMKRFQGELINKYLLFSTIALLSMIICEEIMCERIEVKQEKEKCIVGVDANSVSFVFGILFIISAPFFYKIMVTQFLAAREFGYGEIYDLSNNTLYESLSMWYVPSLFALFYCNKNKNIKYVYLILLLIPVLGYLYIGTRSKPMAILICLLYLWDSSIKKFSKKRIALLFLVCIFMLVVISTISYIRGTSNRSIEDMYEVAINVGVSDSVVHALGEFGSSMQVWIRLQHIIPEKAGYGFGFSYLSAVLSCIPSVLLGGFSFARYSNLSVWITNIENANYGLGFSMLGEAYYNFGWIGAIFFGFICRFVFYMLSGNWVPKRMKNYQNIFSAIALYIFATAGRGAMYLAVRYILYCMIIPIVAILLLDSKNSIHFRAKENKLLEIGSDSK